MNDLNLKSVKGRIGVVILAAGESKRFKSVKQLAAWRNHTLIENAVSAARRLALLEKRITGIVVVLGANAEQILRETDLSETEVVVNTDWREGIASSIRTGLSILQQDGDCDAILFMLCDQPFVTADILGRLIQRFTNSSKNIACAYYNEGPGVPAIFSSMYFDQLHSLKGDTGASRIIKSNSNDVETLPCEEAARDIDSGGDYEKAKREVQ